MQAQTNQTRNENYAMATPREATTGVGSQQSSGTGSGSAAGIKPEYSQYSDDRLASGYSGSAPGIPAYQPWSTTSGDYGPTRYSGRDCLARYGGSNGMSAYQTQTATSGCDGLARYSGLNDTSAYQAPLGSSYDDDCFRSRQSSTSSCYGVTQLSPCCSSATANPVPGD